MKCLKAKNANLIFLLVTFWLWLRMRYNKLSRKSVAAYITRQQIRSKNLATIKIYSILISMQVQGSIGHGLEIIVYIYKFQRLELGNLSHIFEWTLQFHLNIKVVIKRRFGVGYLRWDPLVFCETVGSSLETDTISHLKKTLHIYNRYQFPVARFATSTSTVTRKTTKRIVPH